MNREFKFRAWSGKEMFYNVHIGSGGKVPSLHGERDWPIMQYTGLKDKNGKEIYEGDILMSVPFTGSYHPNKQIVDFFGMSFVFRGITKNASPYTDYTIGTITNSEMKVDDSVEVIGNIHENPELLK